ncbi:MAG: PmoA family protein, partial [Thermoguttaceae bacterium]|nr:PmoA family protein [Thermoguttaceae bacterium]
IRKDNQALTTYRTNPNQKYPYFYPLVGPVSRVSVVSESAQPWPHHRGVFCCGVDKCNGGNYWQSTRDDGRVISQEVKVISAEKTKVEFTDRCYWLRKDVEPFIEDHRRYVIDWRCDDYYLLDLYYTMNMLTDVEILKTNHGFFGVRVEQDLAPDSGGILVNAEGVVGEKETLGTSSNWMAFYGKRRFNPEITEGVAVFSPPNDPFGAFEKTPWFTRDYGNISPMPFNFVKDDYKFRFPLGSEIKVQYRIVVFAGTPSDVDLNGLWKEFYA